MLLANDQKNISSKDFIFFSINQKKFGRNWKNSTTKSIVEIEPWPIKWLNSLGYDSGNNWTFFHQWINGGDQAILDWKINIFG